MSRGSCLLDTGPLVALLSQQDQQHDRAKSLISSYEQPFITCEAVIVEACFLVAKFDPKGSQKILRLGENGFYQISFQLNEHWNVLTVILEKYRDQSISLADACLIRCAEIHNEPRILTFDSDFEFYRWGRNKKFEILSV